MSSTLIELIKEYASESSVDITGLSEENSMVICGAGISRPSGLPDGWTLIKSVLDTFDLGEKSTVNLLRRFSDYNQEVIQRVLGYEVPLFESPRLEVLFKGVKDALEKGEYEAIVKYLLLRSILDDDKYLNNGTYNVTPNSLHYLLSDFIKNNGLCLTANFDKLIEIAYYNLTGLELDVHSFPLTEKQEVKNTHGHTLIKYHGTIEQTNQIGLDISSIPINGFREPESNLLKSKLEKVCNVIFIGFSLSDTIDLVPFLKSLGIKFNFFFFRYIGEENPPIKKLELYEPQKLIGLKKIQTYEYAFKRSLSSTIKNCYIVNDYKNIDILAKTKYSLRTNTVYQVSQSEQVILVQNFHNILSESSINKRKVVQFQILRTLGLINYVDLADLENISLGNLDIQVKEKLIDYFKNVNGNYFSNLKPHIYKYKTESKNNANNLSLISALQEFIFLQQGNISSRLYRTPLLAIVWAKVYYSKNKCTDKADKLRVIRSLSLPVLRVLQAAFDRKLNWLIPNFVLNYYEKSLFQQISLTQELNNLMDFRFSKKELIYLYGMFPYYFKKVSHQELVDELDELFLLNLDTNYLIDANNLLRFGYTTINKERYEKPTLKSLLISEDFLNMYKVLKTKYSTPSA